MKGILVLAVVAALSAGLVPVAADDYLGDFTCPPEGPTWGSYIPEQQGFNYSIYVGVAYPTGLLKNEGRFLIGMDWYGPSDFPFNANSAVGVSMEWSQLQTDRGRDFDWIPVLANWRQYFKWGAARPFVTLGAGVIVTDIAAHYVGWIDGINFGWTGGIGLSLSNTIYLQGRFIGGKNPSDSGVVAVDFGYRF